MTGLKVSWQTKLKRKAVTFRFCMYLSDYDILTSSNNGILQEISRNLVDEVPSTWSPIVSCILHGTSITRVCYIIHGWCQKCHTRDSDYLKQGEVDGLVAIIFPHVTNSRILHIGPSFNRTLSRSITSRRSQPSGSIQTLRKPDRQWRTRIQGSYNTPLEHTPGNPPFANHERNPFIPCW